MRVKIKLLGIASIVLPALALSPIAAADGASKLDRVEVPGKHVDDMISPDGNFSAGMPAFTLPTGGFPIGNGLDQRATANSTHGAGTGTAAASPCADATGAASSNPASAHPVVISTGAKQWTQSDFPHFSPLPLSLSRHYQSDTAMVGMFGPAWQASYELNIVGGLWSCSNGNCTTGYFKVVAPDGTVYMMNYAQAPGNQSQFASVQAFLPPASIAESQTWTQQTFFTNVSRKKVAAIMNPPNKTLVVFLNGRDYHFSSPNGYDYQLDFVHTPGGTSYTYTRDSSRKLQSISNAYGAIVRFTWAPDGSHVTGITAPDGKVWGYAYNTSGMLTTVTPPQPSLGVYTYFYENANNSKWLTGYAIDGVRATRYDYDASGRVTRSAAIDGTFNDTFVYNATSTVQTDVRGQATTHNFVTVSGQKQWSSSSGNATAYCPAAASSQTYDSNGFASATYDRNGNKTSFTFDKDGFLIAKTTAVGTPGAQTTTYAYTTASNGYTTRLTTATVSDANGANVVQYNYNYTETILGALPTQVTIVDLKTGAPTRTTTTAYALFGSGGVQTKTVNETIPGGTATSVYTYDANGNLVSYRNAAGLTTTYAGYNGLGLPSSATDPNGTASSFTYDVRGNTLTVAKTGAPTITMSYGVMGKPFSSHPRMGMPLQTPTAVQGV